VTQIPAGTARYFAWLYSSARMQAVLAPLFGIETEINTALQPGLEHSVAHVRMTWWAEEAQRLRTGHALHPLTRALLAQQPAAAAGSAAGPDITGLVDIATWDLASATFDTREELSGYCGRWAQAVMRLAVVCGAPEVQAQTAEQFAAGAGEAVCELEMLISLERSARLGRLRIPLEELARLDVAPESLALTPWPAALCERLRARHRELRGTLTTSCALLRAPHHRVALRGLLVWCALMQQHSRRAEAALPRSWQRNRWQGVGDALRAWRTARRAMRRQSAIPLNSSLKTSERP